MEKGDSVRTAENNTSLLSDFDYPRPDDWKASAADLLKGKDFDSTLRTLTYEGIVLDPIYVKENIEGLKTDSLPGRENFLRGQTPEGNLGGGWGICQRMGSGIPEEFNTELLSDLASGQNVIFISPDPATAAGKDPADSSAGQVAVNGLSLSVIGDISDALKNIDLDKYPLVFDTNVAGMELMMLLEACLAQNGERKGKMTCNLNMDPLGYLAEKEVLDASPEHYYKKMALLIRRINGKGSDVRIAGVSALPYHNAGASSVQELAIALSTGVEYIEALKRFDIPPEKTAGAMAFRFGIGSDFFMEIAKLRAARVLWNGIQEEYGIAEEDRGIFLHSETSMFNQSRLDLHVNMLRVTTEAFSAAAGGADCITTNPFDRVLRPAGTFSKRVARNVQTVIREESHLHKLIDPAGGSYFVEKLTADLAGKAWDLFLEIEKRGGMQKSLESGFIRDILSAGRTKLEELIATRKKIMVGTNNYGNPEESIQNEVSADTVRLFSLRTEVINGYKERMKDHRGSLDYDGLKKAFERNDPGIMDRGMQCLVDGATIGELSGLLRGDERCFSIEGKGPEILRLSGKMEKLREDVLEFRNSSGIKSEVLIAVDEPFLKIKPRGDFAKSFFETGGFNTRIIRLGGELQDKAGQIAESESRIIVLCGADTDYPDTVPVVVPELRKRIPGSVIVLAGDPGGNRELFIRHGVDFFIYRGTDLPDTISGILNKAGA